MRAERKRRRDKCGVYRGRREAQRAWELLASGRCGVETVRRRCGGGGGGPGLLVLVPLPPCPPFCCCCCCCARTLLVIGPPAQPQHHVVRLDRIITLARRVYTVQWYGLHQGLTQPPARPRMPAAMRDTHRHMRPLVPHPQSAPQSALHYVHMDSA